MAYRINIPCKYPGCPNTVTKPGARYCETHEGGRLMPCRQPGCSALVPDGGYCKDHGPRDNAGARGYDANWQKFRRQYLSRHPWCAVTGDPAEVVDHIKPLRSGGEKYNESNLQPLTARIHNIKTGWEKR